MVQRGAEMKLPNKKIIKAVSRNKTRTAFFYNSNKAPAKSVAILRQKNKSPQAIPSFLTPHSSLETLF